MEPILEIRNLNSFYHQGGGAFSKKRTVQVLKNVNVTLGQGEVLGLVGESGSGKSTLAKSILGMTEYQGEIIHHSRRPQMVFQDPYSSLNPAFSIRRIVEEPLRIFGKYPAAEIRPPGRRRCSATWGWTRSSTTGSPASSPAGSGSGCPSPQP